MSDVTIQDVFDRFLPEYSETGNFSKRQYDTVNCILKCRTADCGFNVSECENCRTRYIHYNSCKNRNCPMCQAMEVDEWIDIQKENVLNTTYFHTVFTVPEELYPLMYSNQRRLYDALYHAAARTLKELSRDPKYLGAETGFICVLHTWGSRMNYHPHLHTIVLGGGLNEKNQWTDKGGNAFIPVKVMSAVFRKHYLNELKELNDRNRLEYHGSAEKYRNHYEYRELLNKLYNREWIVFTKKAFNGADSVIAYLGRYTHRIAISNSRIIRIDGENVIYKAKDYANGGCMIPASEKGTEFIRMFLMHVLPAGFVRIRHYGVLSFRSRKEKIALCRNLLGCKQYISMLRGKSPAEKILLLYKRDINKCSKCGNGISLIATQRGRYMLC